jgi:biopolymer transport protein TolQ
LTYIAGIKAGFAGARGLLMKLKLAAAVAVLAISLAAPALGQSTPQAAPTGSPAQTQDLGAPAAAPPTNVDVTQTGSAAGPDVGGISVVSLFMRADPFVKAVLLILLLASIWSWTIIISKWLVLGSLRRRAEKFEKTFWSGLSLDELYQQFAQKADHPMAAVFVSALREWRRAFEGGAPREAFLPGIKDRIDKAMSVTVMRETDGLERQLGFLATVGATATFIGLFGTVWGIMNSFSAIAARHDTTLAVVGHGPPRSHSGRHLLQQVHQRYRPLYDTARSLLRRVLRDPVAPAR